MTSTTKAHRGPFPIKDKIALITGGGSGIGLAFAQHLHSKGARVLLGDLKLTPEAEAFLHSTEAGAVVASPADHAAEVEIQTQDGTTTTIPTAATATAVFQRCDVTNWADLHALVSRSVQEFGAVPDIYCPCAGVFEPAWSNFWDDTEAGGGDQGTSGYAALRINTEHPIKLTRLAFRALVGAEKRGVVLLVASVAGLAGYYSTAMYSASKHAIVGFCKSMYHADEEEGVKVVCVCPGMVETPLWEARDDGAAEVYQYGAAKSRAVTNSAAEIAVLMGRMVEEEQFVSGSIYVKTHTREELLVDTEPSRLGFERPKAALDKERGKPWTL
ncbi:hypothetical protein BD289DRAFT_181138 [Coniella lustricola]|uniref:NAD(P)-binding protein n=1 Tax=Coniella lustricola TaxID=2025994 RepID=A0A2T3ADD3_9PEZI|nr:hypothetical protein BD289DRAFT_181138 [Coniella lustricola]